MSENSEPDTQDHPSLGNKVIILNGFDYEEITKIMRAVKALFDKPKDLIFAKTTDSSLQMKLADLIIDMSEDHEYLKNNPPGGPKGAAQQNSESAPPSASDHAGESTRDSGTE
ncbi:MAG: DUF3783 domain-containing protein [Spirochaetia bacterium]